MINDCIKVGLENDISTMKRLCSLAYKQLASYDIISYYKKCAISHATGILANRKRSIRVNASKLGFHKKA
jgi:putative transposase